MKNILSIITVIIFVAAITAGITKLFFPDEKIVYKEKETLMIKTNTIIQIKEKPIIITELPDIIKTNTNLMALLIELNQYKTNNGWIAVTNNRIHAGLFNRQWSVEFKTREVLFNEIGILAGSGFGAYYSRLLEDDWTLGGIVCVDFDKNWNAYLKGGMRF